MYEENNFFFYICKNITRKKHVDYRKIERQILQFLYDLEMHEKTRVIYKKCGIALR